MWQTSPAWLQVSDLWCLAQDVGKRLEAHLGASSLTMAIQDGPAAGQTVAHVHVHILPRRSGDFEKNDEVYDALDREERQYTEARKALATARVAAVDWIDVSPCRPSNCCSSRATSSTSTSSESPGHQRRWQPRRPSLEGCGCNAACCVHFLPDIPQKNGWL